MHHLFWLFSLGRWCWDFCSVVTGLWKFDALFQLTTEISGLPCLLAATLCLISKVAHTYNQSQYRGFSPYANFITANFITAIFQNFPKIFGLCDFMYYLFCYCDFYNWLMRFYVLFISLLWSICLMRLFPSPKSRIRREPSVRSNDFRRFHQIFVTLLENLRSESWIFEVQIRWQFLGFSNNSLVI